MGILACFTLDRGSSWRINSRISTSRNSVSLARRYRICIPLYFWAMGTLYANLIFCSCICTCLFHFRTGIRNMGVSKQNCRGSASTSIELYANLTSFFISSSDHGSFWCRRSCRSYRDYYLCNPPHDPANHSWIKKNFPGYC